MKLAALRGGFFLARRHPKQNHGAQPPGVHSHREQGEADTPIFHRPYLAPALSSTGQMLRPPGLPLTQSLHDPPLGVAFLLGRRLSETRRTARSCQVAEKTNEGV
jgi:hypothetical protein